MSDPNPQATPELNDYVEDADAETSQNTPAEEEAVDELELLRQENGELRNMLARKQADYQNSQRRLEKDASQRLKVAAGQLVREFLPVVDNLERALDVPDTVDVATVLNGVRGTYTQLVDVLKTNGVESIAPEVDEPFNPEHHEALMQEPRNPAPDTQVVTRVLQKGYSFDGRVIRPAQVAVSASA